MSLHLSGFRSTGNTNPSRFVTVVSGSAGYVDQATPSTFIIGVSQKGTQEAPGTAADSGYAATAGRPLTVHMPGSVALLKLGGTVSAGDRLTADASGQGVKVATTATAHTYVGAIALSNGVSGDLIDVMVWPYDGPQSN